MVLCKLNHRESINQSAPAEAGIHLCQFAVYPGGGNLLGAALIFRLAPSVRGKLFFLKLINSAPKECY
jgi:hypothetical protein